MSDWIPAPAEPRVQTRFTGYGYQARWLLPIPKTRGRCGVCRKDIVLLKSVTGDERIWKHKCGDAEKWIATTNGAMERGYGYCKEAGGIRLFGTPTQAIAVAKDLAGFTPRMVQIVSPDLVA